MTIMDPPHAGQKRIRDSPRTTSPAVKRQKLLDSRKSLPIWSRAGDIRKALEENHVLVLSGETGSGKSTQVPQFLLESSWCSGKIAVTQPRKVAAISLARRVADEMGSTLGTASPASKVGYSVRFDDNTSPSTRIKFLTEGMLLQEMLRDATLSQYSCIVVDEVHERSVNVDLILGFLKGIVQGRTKRKTPLKVVVMSATADVVGISKFFSERTVPAARTGALGEGNASHPDSQSAQIESNSHDQSSEASWEGLSDDGEPPNDSVALHHVEGRQYPVKLNYLSTPTEDLLDTTLQRIFNIHCKEAMPGDILVFLTGQELILDLQKAVENFAQNLTREYPGILVLPLFAALPQTAQQRIFEPAPLNTRKVVLSTNIAETSITVPGVRFVVDTGKAKIKQFRNRLGLESLLVKPISKSSANQRKGRAGREAAGQCYRLYTDDAYRTLEKDTKPEILRCDLSSALLTMHARGIDASDVFTFPFLTPPSHEAVEKALLHLHQLGCLDDRGKITPTGRQIARLPLTPSRGKIVLEAAQPDKDCLLEVIDIVACLSVDSSIFLKPATEEDEETAAAARAKLRRRQGDHLTLLETVRAYANEASDRRRWASEHHISHRAMQNVLAVRKQLTAQCKTLRPAASPPTVRESIDERTQDSILQCFLQGYRENFARLGPDRTYKNLDNQTVAIHPSSVLFERRGKPRWIVYDEYVFTDRAYARNVSEVQMGWAMGLWDGEEEGDGVDGDESI